MVKWAISALALLVFLYFSVPYILSSLLSSMTTEDYFEDVDIKHLSIDPGHVHYYEIEIDGKSIHFNLLDPGMAPPDIREKVLLGFNIIREAETYAEEYVGGKISCINCHFCGGNTFGGKSGSISLVGAPFWFPEYSEREKKYNTLEDRINNCFKRSLNGKPLPKGSHLMEALVAYLDWISHEVKNLKKYPWRGLKPLASEHIPDYHQGRKIYQQKCALCHNSNGNGSCELGCTVKIPPLWGDNSFNDGAGMSVPHKMASFVHCNMPFGQPSLTEDEAIDVTDYVLKQPRPHFIP